MLGLTRNKVDLENGGRGGTEMDEKTGSEPSQVCCLSQLLHHQPLLSKMSLLVGRISRCQKSNSHLGHLPLDNATLTPLYYLAMRQVTQPPLRLATPPPRGTIPHANNREFDWHRQHEDSKQVPAAPAQALQQCMSEMPECGFNTSG
jgi:hypothetical protein